MAPAFVKNWMAKRIGAPQALPAVLTRKRLYTMPTGAGWLLLIVSLAGIISALNYTSNEALLVVLIVGSAGLFSLLSGHQLLNGIKVVSIIAESAHEGDEVYLDIEIHAKPNAKGILVMTGDGHASFTVDASGRGRAQLAIQAVKRGVWIAPRICFATRQPLGLATSWTWIWAEGVEFKVWPALEDEPAPLPQMNSGERQAVNSAMQSQDIRSLRPYRHGDPVRQIAWKQTIRTGTTMVREYDRPSGQAIIDWDAIDLPLEQKLRRIGTWVVEAERCGRPTHLILPSQTIGPGRGLGHKRACLDALAEIPGE